MKMTAKQWRGQARLSLAGVSNSLKAKGNTKQFLLLLFLSFLLSVSCDNSEVCLFTPGFSGVWFLAILGLLCVIIAVAVVNFRRLLARNRVLLNRIEHQDEQELLHDWLRDKLAQKCLCVKMENGMEDEKEKDEKKQSDLYFKLTELMKDSSVYTDPDVNRKSIARKLGTNEKYIFLTIREYYGTNISDYINNLRLNYARRLLAQPSAKLTVEAIALQAGFKSRSVFYRLFKKHYGVTPVEFRRLVNGGPGKAVLTVRGNRMLTFL